jgi:hypothetical protein
MRRPPIREAEVEAIGKAMTGAAEGFSLAADQDWTRKSPSRGAVKGFEGLEDLGAMAFVRK